MRRAVRKSSKKRFRNSKYAPNVYDVSVITAFVILVVTVTYVSVGPVPAQTNVAGQAGLAALDNIICVKNYYGDIVCSSVSEGVEADNKIFSSCSGELGCTITCVELINACTDRGSFSACALQNKFC